MTSAQTFLPTAGASRARPVRCRSSAGRRRRPGPSGAPPARDWPRRPARRSWCRRRAARSHRRGWPRSPGVGPPRSCPSRCRSSGARPGTAIDPQVEFDRIRELDIHILRGKGVDRRVGVDGGRTGGHTSDSGVTTRNLRCPRAPARRVGSDRSSAAPDGSRRSRSAWRRPTTAARRTAGSAEERVGGDPADRGQARVRQRVTGQDGGVGGDGLVQAAGRPREPPRSMRRTMASAQDGAGGGPARSHHQATTPTTSATPSARRATATSSSPRRRGRSPRSAHRPDRTRTPPCGSPPEAVRPSTKLPLGSIRNRPISLPS